MLRIEIVKAGEGESAAPRPLVAHRAMAIVPIAAFDPVHSAWRNQPR